MLRGARRDWIRLHRAVSAAWLRQAIDASLGRCAPDDETCRVDAVLTTPDLIVRSDILESWVVERALALGLWSIARLPHREATSEGVHCWREPDGTGLCSLPLRHRHHSFTGYGWGDVGSAAADLALNILAVFLPLAPEAHGVVLRDGSSVSATAWELHQPFMQDLVATMPRAGGTITVDMIRIWLATHPQS
jgi:hypothetical protein